MKLTIKQEQFCQEVVKGKKLYEAYRLAYHPKRATRKSLYEQASHLMDDLKIQSRIAVLLAPVVERIQTSQVAWLEQAERFNKADIRKMFDSHGNPLEIKDLGPNEAAMVAGFEFVEQYEAVEDKDTGTKRAIATGITKKVRIGLPFLEAHKYLGKVLGYYKETHEFTGSLTLEQLVGVLVTTEEPPSRKLLNG